MKKKIVLKIIKKSPSSLAIGQTLETKDEYLPHNKKMTQQLKSSRPVIIVDKFINDKGKEEYAVVPGSTQNNSNTTYYGKYGIKSYRHTLEVNDNEGKAISRNEKFKLTKTCTKIPINDAKTIRRNILNHTKQSSENRKKYDEFKNRYKKSKR